MTDQTKQSPVERRSVLRAVGSLALVGAVAGCTTDTSGDGGDGDSGSDGSDGGSDGGDGGDSDSGSDGGDGGADFDQGSVDSYLSDTSNYDGVVDETGSSSVTVEVGVEQGGGPFGFGPAAVQVDSGTTVQWEWNGEGGDHNVVHTDGEFESELFSDAGLHYERDFEEEGVHNYFCRPHESVNMKGSVVVTE